MICPFCTLATDLHTWASPLTVAIRDRFPVSPGHTLVIPRRHVETYFAATSDQQADLWRAVAEIKRALDEELHPDGYNVGFNAGAAAGQTVMHLHVHVIPRFTGDMDDPRGGVRHVIPGRGNYLKARPRALATGGTVDPFLHHVLPLLDRATDVAIVAAFVQESGLDELLPSLRGALHRGTRIRLVTGDYLNITQVAALERLLDLASSNLGLADGETTDSSGTSNAPGTFEARVVETGALPPPVRSFHPKSWRFEGLDFATAFVGSSNLSRSALRSGIEWNLRIDRDRDAAGWTELVTAFESLWELARPLTADWVAEYAKRAREEARPLPSGEDDAEPLATPPPRNEFQVAALDALRAGRREGRRRALVVLATGLGKTWLSAFDADAVRRDRPDGRLRVLFIAHRGELLRQAAATFRCLWRENGPGPRVGWCIGDRTELDAELVFASVQKLSRADVLGRISPRAFDYIVVDEVHHAAAASYRRILDRLDPEFLLGLTATPDRGDAADVLGLFDDNLAYRADLGDGIDKGRLAPFAYFGLADSVDYANIPWRNHRFDPEELARAVETEMRMQRLWTGWEAHRGHRTLVFCCSIRHAQFARDWLRARGVAVEAIFSAEGSFDRQDGLDRLRDGGLQALCVVDLFNEGVDIPEVDRVVMLRPTESPVVFLQQLGRGLRPWAGKDRLVVIDFVGNDRVFFERVRTLLSLAGGVPRIREFLQGARPDLPDGCRVEVELEARDLLLRLMRTGKNALEQAFNELREAHGRRPTIGEVYRLGYLPRSLLKGHGSWFEFVDSMGALLPEEQRVLALARDWLRDVETTEMSRSYKMITLEALLEAGALLDGMSVPELARRSHRVLARSPELLKDLEGTSEIDDPRKPSEARWLAYWKKNPINAWAPGGRGRWFSVEGDCFSLRLSIEEALRPALEAMTLELVDYRLAQYRKRFEPQTSGGVTRFEAKVTWNQRDPILKLPRFDGRPVGEIPVRLSDGSVWQFRFMKEYCNVARPVGTPRNLLSDKLREWFGPSAGRPGTGFHVRFSLSPDGWWAEPLGGQVLPLPMRGRVLSFPDLRAAAGSAIGPTPTDDEPAADVVVLPVRTADEGVFAVRASGDSMEGGSDPIHDGDWVVFRWGRGRGLGAIANRRALVQVPDAGGYGYQIKRVVERDGAWVLKSDNPARPSFDASASTVPLAVVEEVISPERLAPQSGTRIAAAELGGAFGHEVSPTPEEVCRQGGHLFLFVSAAGRFFAPNRLRIPVIDRRPAETAFVLVAAEEPAHWIYLGIGRWLDDEACWSVPELDFPHVASVGHRRECIAPAAATLPGPGPHRGCPCPRGTCREVDRGSWEAMPHRARERAGRPAHRWWRRWVHRTDSLGDGYWMGADGP